MLPEFGNFTSPLATVLERNGWQASPDGPRIWRRVGDRGGATLQCQYESGLWMHCLLGGAAAPKTTPRGLLAANHALLGPLKFVRGRSGKTLLRADLPLQFLASLEADELSLDEAGGCSLESPLASLVRDIGAAVGGESPSAPRFDAEAVTAAVNELGFVAAPAGQGVRITLTFGESFSHVSLFQEGVSGVRVQAPLASLAGLSRVSLDAVRRMAHEVNERTRLARISLAGERGREVLFAETHLGSAPAPGPWLALALEAIRSALSLCLKSFTGLREPKLAALVLDATASAQT